ncbi:hypothetical protein [Pelagimonas phthalicica]|uniref:hypothetical protein n=1 Tax=Pelagimonas phthalicica TaxID=1037362 RepID=UPI00105D2F6C|nr:hypothetical protein [Pelagimonas phthalicica]
MLRLATKLFGDASGQVDPSDKIELPFLGDQASLWLQDVGGLIDLNSAAPDLLNLLAREFSVSEDAMERFRQWRRTPHRLQSVTDFARVAEIDPEIVEGLDPFATVYSGRFGVAIEEAPIALQSALRREAWPLPEPWATQPSGQVFKVFLQPSGKTARAIGTIKLRSEEQPERVLELRQ